MRSKDQGIVVFIPGAYISHHCWTRWQEYFEEAGYVTHAPAWPYKDGDAEELRNKADGSGLAALGLTQVLSHYERIIQELPHLPVIVGHDLGGLIAQLLVQRGLAEAAVLVHSVAPAGLFSWSCFRSLLRKGKFFRPTRRPSVLDFREWQTLYTNGMSADEQTTGYYRWVVPESKQLLKDCTGEAARIDFHKAHAPLLFISGSADRVTPASLNYKNYRKYLHAGSITGYMEFNGRNHYTLDQEGWEETAAFALNWINKL